MINMHELVDTIKQWATERELDTAEPRTQINKLVEELGELSGSFTRYNEPVMKDSLGDMFVVMTVFSQQMGFDLVECIKDAVSEISNRKCKMIDGAFVKEADLN